MSRQKGFKTKLDEALKEVEVSETMLDQIRRRTYQKPIIKISKKKRLKRQLVLVGLILLIASTSIGAVGYYIKGFGSFLDAKHLKEIQDNIVTINQVQEVKGITVKIEEGMIDADRAFFVVSMTRKDENWPEDIEATFYTDNFEDSARNITEPIYSENGKKLTYIVEVLAPKLSTRKNLELRIGPIMQHRVWQEVVNCRLGDNVTITDQSPEVKVRGVECLKEGEASNPKYSQLRHSIIGNAQGLLIYIGNDLIKEGGNMANQYQVYPTKLYLENEKTKEEYESGSYCVDDNTGISTFNLPKMCQKDQVQNLRLTKVEFEQEKILCNGYLKMAMDLKPLKDKMAKNLIDKPIEVGMDGRNVEIESIYYSRFGICIQVRDKERQKEFGLEVQVQNKDGSFKEYSSGKHMFREDGDQGYYLICYDNRMNKENINEEDQVKRIIVNGKVVVEFE